MTYLGLLKKTEGEGDRRLVRGWMGNVDRGILLLELLGKLLEEKLKGDGGSDKLLRGVRAGRPRDVVVWFERTDSGRPCIGGCSIKRGPPCG